jgi:hypothetical protein
MPLVSSGGEQPRKLLLVCHAAFSSENSRFPRCCGFLWRSAWHRIDNCINNAR